MLPSLLLCCVLASSADPAPETPRTARDVFLAGLVHFEGVGARTFEEELVRFVDGQLAQTSRESEEAARRDRTAVLVGLGALFDSGDVLKRTPVVGRLLRGVILSDEETAARDKLCSHARIARRHDAPKHFFLAAALTTRGGPGAAAQASLVKEFEDARRYDLTPPSGTGFSYLDLAYDHAGIRFASWLLGWKAPVRLGQEPLSLTGFLPNFKELKLPERIGWQRFQEEYRGERTEAYLDEIHAAIDARLAEETTAEPESSDASDETPTPPGKP